MAKGVSTIIASVIMIALVLVIGGVVWSVVNGIVQDNLEGTGTCFKVFDQVEFNRGYTCWNNTGNETRFSVNIKDANIDEALVTISGSGESKSYRLKPTGAEGNVVLWPSGGQAILPGNNSGKTYSVFNDFKTKPDSIAVYPIIKGNQCDAEDVISTIDSCFILG